MADHARARLGQADQGSPKFSLLDEAISGNLNDMTWRVSGHVPGVAPSSYTVHWRVCDELRATVMHGAWPTWVAYGKRLVQVICDSPSSRIRSGGSIAGLARHVRAFCSFCCFDQGLSSIKRFESSHLEAYIKHVQSLGLKAGSVDAKLAVLSHAWRARSEIESGLERGPFGYRERAAIARRIGLPGGHTPTIPAQELFLNLNEALKLIEAAPALLDDLDKYLNYSGKRRLRSAWFEVECGRSSRAMFRDARATYGACIALLLAFTAARKHEGASVQDEDAVRSIKENIDLVSREYKGARSAGGRQTSRPLNDAVRNAIDVIRGLTRGTRLSSHERTLLLRLPFQHSCSGRGDSHDALDSRGIYNLLDAFSVHAGTEQKLRPHVFRRAYAMLWMWRFEMEDLLFLSRVLLHNSPDFTKVYVEDENSWSFMSEAMRELTVEVLEESLLGVRAMGGGISSTLRRYVRILQVSVVTVDAHSVDAIIKRIVDGHGLRIVPNADGYCFMSSARGRRAKCSLDGVMPNYANRTSSLCFGCPNFGVDFSRKAVWKDRLNRHQIVFRTTAYPALRAASREAIAMCRRVLSWIGKER